MKEFAKLLLDEIIWFLKNKNPTTVDDKLNDHTNNYTFDLKNIKNAL